MKAGHWQKCVANIAHKRVEVLFFKKPKYPHDYCELCVYEIRKRNGSLITTSQGFQNSTHKSNESKPERDSL